jgi:UDP-N-acetylglucosamine diphosphorylase/glucosamine-1-phosphate N-acetyltransferase
MELLNVIILAGGLGKRMNSDKPKVLHEVNGVPMIIHVLQSGIDLHPEKILIVVGKYKNQIRQTIEKHILYPIIYVDQNEPLGTGNAVQQCVSFLTSNAKVVILSGDVPLIQTETIQNLILQTKFCGLIATNVDQPTGLGRIILNNGVFECIVEEKDCTSEQKICNLVNSGIYCVQSKLIESHIFKLENTNAQNEYYLTDLITMIKKVHPIDLIILSKEQQYQVMGVNNQNELEKLNRRYYGF